MRLCILIIFLCSFTKTIQAGPIVLHSNAKFSVSSGFTYLFDSTKSLSLKDVKEASANGRFLLPDEKLFKSGLNVYWLHFFLENETKFDNEWILNFQNWSLIDAYLKEEEKFAIHRSGHLYPYNQRDYSVSNKAYILISLKKGEIKECFIRVESRYNNELIPANLNFEIASRTVVDSENAFISKVIFSFLSVLLIMFVYNLFIYLSTRLRSYLYYLFVIFFAFYHTAYNSGYLIEIFRFFYGFPVTLTYFETLSSNLFGISIVLFASEFLQVKSRYPFWYKIIKIILYSYVVFGILLLINLQAGTIATSFLGLVTIVTIIFLAIKSARDKFPSAVYFLAGFSAFFLGLLGIILSVVGLIPENVWTLSFSLPLGTTVEIIFFSFALGNMINVLRIQNEEHQRRIIEQLTENHLLQTKVNRELEEKVLERTAEINRQKEEVSLQKEKVEIEREKSEKLLLNILPESIANELKEKGYATPKLYENVTILFTDFVGFADITQNLDAKTLVNNVDYCFQRFDEIITEHRLEKIKTIGDSYMAICGVPVPDVNHSTNTVKAALAIRSFIEEWMTLKISKGEDPWEIRIGIHSGSVVAGVVGKKKFAFDIWSDTVNTASRMESSCEKGKINISGATYELIKDKFNCIHRGKITAKSKGEIDMYFVLDCYEKTV